MSATIQFKTKLVEVEYMEGGHAFTQINVPQFTKAHCDMPAFRKHKRWGYVANSQLFPNVLKRLRQDVAPHGWLKLEDLPENVTVDTSKFLALVTITIP